MNPFMQVERGYIIYVGAGNTKIQQEKADEINRIINDMPTAPDGYRYRLKTDLTWEMYESHEQDEPTVEDKAEAYDILMGVSE